MLTRAYSGLTPVELSTYYGNPPPPYDASSTRSSNPIPHSATTEGAFFIIPTQPSDIYGNHGTVFLLLVSKFKF